MIIYEPIIRETPNIYDKYPSAWGDIPTIIKDIIIRFNLKTNLCLEFGVENGYSTSVFSNYFKQVIGVDTFEGDIHTIDKVEHYDRTKEELSIFENINLIKNDFVDFIKDDKNNIFYDLIHIDIVHTYNETYSCGEWSVNRAPITIFHDTESFEDVKKVCIDLSEKYNLEFFNYPDSHGLGILFNKKLYQENV